MNAEALLYAGYLAICHKLNLSNDYILEEWEMEWAPGEAAEWLQKIATGDYWLDISGAWGDKFNIALGGY